MKPTNEELRDTVRAKYAEIAAASDSCCAEVSCCDGGASEPGDFTMIGDAYDGVEGYQSDADLGLGCGLPVEHARLEPGQTVLDLGSGAGLDAFIARHEVGADGRVIGVDMTAEMIAKSRENARQAGHENVEFRLGEIEHLPVRSASVDVVVSNCVLNLVPDKQRAFSEIFRVLKPGGRFCISDIVAASALPDWARGVAEAYAGCVSGAIPRQDYLDLISQAGFESVNIAAERRIDLPEEWLDRLLTEEQRREAEQHDLHVLSVTVTGSRPA
jgi:SAM-dependent methyltransferase